jgi:hypothetical protein
MLHAYLHRDAFGPADAGSHSGGHLRDGVDPNEPKGARSSKPPM